jgi:nephrocystin-3
MVEDRNELMTQVWPELRRFCRERQVEFVEVDLRWGIPESQSTRKEALKICLDEIQSCRPFFVGLLGERYGWVPGEDAYTSDLEQEQPWVKALKDRGITELEILHGVLNHPEMAHRALFYLRDPAYAKARGAQFLSDSAIGATKQEALKKRVSEACENWHMSLRLNYADPRELAGLVLEDLKRLIEGEFPLEEVPDALAREARDHEAFAEMRRRTYVKRSDYLTTLDMHAEGIGGPLVVVGPSGCGKSALLANWTQHVREIRPPDIVVEHYVGGAAGSSDYLGFVARIANEIKRWTNAPEEVPTRPDDLLRDFVPWLARARSKAQRDGVRFIIVLDAIDQFEAVHEARHLGWLDPEVFVGSLRLVVSALPGDVLDEMMARGWDQLHIEPLREGERRSMVREYLRRFGKVLEESHLDLIAFSPATSNPLYLKILLDELRVTGTYDGLDERLRDYLSCTDTPALLQRVLARYEKDYDRDRKGLVREALGAIWSAHRGLTENELLQLLKPSDKTQLPAATWAPLRAALEEGLVDRGGVLDFSHEFLRSAVEAAYVPDAATRDSLRHRLADYFERRPVDGRSCDELPWLLEQVGERDRLRACLLDIPRFQHMFSRSEAALGSHWTRLGEAQAMGAAYADAFARWAASGAPESLRDESWTAHELGRFLSGFAQYDAAEQLLRISLERIEEYSGSDAPDVGSVLRTLAVLLRNRGRMEEAATSLKRALAIDEKWHGPEDLIIAKDLVVLAQLLDCTQHPAEAELMLRRALEIRRAVTGPDSYEYAEVLVSLTSVLCQKESVGDVEQDLHAILRIARRHGGAHGALAANATSQLAGLLQDRGELDEAKKLLESALDIHKSIYGPEHPEVATILNNLGALLVDMHRRAEAEPLLRRSLAIKEAHLGPEHRDVVKARTNLATTLSALGCGDEAAALAHRAVASYELEPEVSRDAAAYAIALNTLSLVLNGQGRREEADAAQVSSLRAMITATRRTGRSGTGLRLLVSNFLTEMNNRDVEPAEARRRLDEIFSRDMALEMLPPILHSLASGAAPTVSVEPPVRHASDVELEMVSTERRQRIAEVHARLRERVQAHMTRIEGIGTVPEAICTRALEVFEEHADGVAIEILGAIEADEDVWQLHASSPGNPVLLVVTVFCCARPLAIERMLARASTTGLGYTCLLTSVLNRWPSPELVALFHLVVCADDGALECHAGLYDMGGGVGAPMNFSILPSELFAPLERAQLLPGPYPSDSAR